MTKFSLILRVRAALPALTMVLCGGAAHAQSCGAFSFASNYFGPAALPTGLNNVVGSQAVTVSGGTGVSISYIFLLNGTLLGSTSVGTGCFPVVISGSGTTASGKPSGLAPSTAVTGDFNKDGHADVAISDRRGNVLVYLSHGSTALSLSATYPVGSLPGSIVAADMNGDGALDLAVANTGSRTISILLGKGDGTFQSSKPYTAGGYPSSMAAADVNGDGSADLVVADCGNIECNSAASSFIAVLAGHGDGTFGSPAVVVNGVAAATVVTADFNGDGFVDIALGDLATNSVSVSLGDGTGAFASPVLSGTDIEPDFLAYGDFSHDGIEDIAVLDHSAGTVTILKGIGNGTFSAGLPQVVGNNHGGLAVGDYNGDGLLDISLLDSLTGSLQFLLNRGGASFIAPSAYQTVANPSFLVAGDFNGDGKPDFLVANISSNVMTLFLGAGNGGFYPGAPIPLPAGGVPTAIAAADFNGDKKTDVIVATLAGNFILLGGQAGLAAPQTVAISGTQISSVPETIAVGDFNGDGKLDIAAMAGSSNGMDLGVYAGTGTGSFTSLYTASFSTVTSPVAAATPDLNGDGKADLVVIDGGGYNVGTGTNQLGAVDVLINNGSGSGFAAPVIYNAATFPFAVVAGDFNKDGKADVAVVTVNGDGDGYVALLTGTGTGTLNAATFTATDLNPESIATADFNGDGKPDLVVSTGVAMDFLFGDGAGNFGNIGHIPIGPSANGVAVADFNGDGKPDVVVTSSAGTEPFGFGIVLLNKAVPALISTSVVNGASFETNQAVAPASIAAAFGSDLATQTAGATSTTTSLGGTTLSITDSAGKTFATDLFYVSPTQVNFLVPSGVALGAAFFSIQSGDGKVSTGYMSVAAAAPGLFTANGLLAAGNLVYALPDGTQTPADIAQCSATGCTAIPIDVNSPQGKAVLVLYGTGMRGAALADVTVQAGVVTINPYYAGAQPSFAGLDQVDFPLPSSLAGAGDISITVTAGGVTSNPVHVTIQ